MVLSIGVVHLGHRADQRALGVVAPVEGERVEEVAERPGLGEHQHLAAVEQDALAGQVGVQVLSQGQPRGPGVVGGPECGERAQRPRDGGKPVEVDQPEVGPVGEGVPERCGADVGDPALVERGAPRPGQFHGPGRCRCRGRHPRPPAHDRTPAASSRRAAITPERQPSSWKPQPWYAPA
ncbi:hypothetical protein GCM10020229_18460 [Kitasatospora albolonga]